TPLELLRGILDEKRLLTPVLTEERFERNQSHSLGQLQVQRPLCARADPKPSASALVNTSSACSTRRSGERELATSETQECSHIGVADAGAAQGSAATTQDGSYPGAPRALAPGAWDADTTLPIVDWDRYTL